eukprot:TRINITY_DN25633_c0_g1_i2.p3 TRINITY_DN25633_c0_g1~~TRINITY_DN25633_c0_g1_i2.p3  ORF type:complete len:102 (+),score=0.51 TRINITY_DN25633_c0_g1_i2:304-609(+)
MFQKIWKLCQIKDISKDSQLTSNFFGKFVIQLTMLLKKMVCQKKLHIIKVHPDSLKGGALQDCFIFSFLQFQFLFVFFWITATKLTIFDCLQIGVVYSKLY